MWNRNATQMRNVLTTEKPSFPQCDAVKPFTTHLLKKQHGFRKFEISNPVQTLYLSLASHEARNKLRIWCWIASPHQDRKGQVLTASMATSSTKRILPLAC